MSWNKCFPPLSATWKDQIYSKNLKHSFLQHDKSIVIFILFSTINNDSYQRWYIATYLYYRDQDFFLLFSHECPSWLAVEGPWPTWCAVSAHISVQPLYTMPVLTPINLSIVDQQTHALAFLTRRLHSSLSFARLLHPRIPRTCKVSLRTTSSYLVFGFPTDLTLKSPN